jgi:uncharacterized protein
VIAIDTNILVYAHRPEMPLHTEARALLESLPSLTSYFALPWPCVHEFLAVVTNGRIFKEPTPLANAFAAVRALDDSGLFRLLSEGDGYLDRLTDLAITGRISGAMIHDARVAAICNFHGVSELWSADRDFNRFPGLNVRNPLLD